jgi:hypothetical protein
MFRLDGRALAFGGAGVVIGAAIVGAAWVIVSAQPEPAARHSRLYDECLAHGRSTIACDAMMRVVADRDAEERKDRERAPIQACSDQYYEQHPVDKNNPFQIHITAAGWKAIEGD